MSINQVNNITYYTEFEKKKYFLQCIIINIQILNKTTTGHKYFYLLTMTLKKKKTLIDYLSFKELPFKEPVYPRHCQARTTDAQRGNSLHCTAENSLPLPNF